MRHGLLRLAPRAAALAGALGLLAGCGLPFGFGHAAHPSTPPTPSTSAASATPSQRPGYATDGTPITIATLQAQYGKLFPGLVFRPELFGAPARPPIDLSQYPPQHAITWASNINPSALPAWERQGAETAAQWFMAEQGNHELTSLQYLVPDEYPAPNNLGMTTGREEAIYSIATNFSYAAKVGGAYEYRTYSRISAVQPPPTPGFAVQYDRLLPKNEQPTHMVVVRVAVFQIAAGGGGYSFGETGPGTVIAADVPGLGWRVVSWSGFPGKQIKVFPQRFHETPIKG